MPVSVVIPCYNEESLIEREIRAFYREIVEKVPDSELVVVDDGSTDGTPALLKKLAAELPRLRIILSGVNRGHGSAVRQGFDAAGKEFVFQVDSDGHFDPRDFWKLYALKDSHDFVLGVRKRRQDPFFRLLLMRVIRAVNFALFGAWIEDANCPFRLIRRDALQELLLSVPGNALAPNLMLAVLCKKRGMRMAEVEVAHIRRGSGFDSVGIGPLIAFALKGLCQLLVWKFRQSV
ncbi:MAG: glycosyltransferase family 2 protein [Candidatus Omnitrophota bacterium]|nr:glycosyltransferase family 2 protein [Candidatus Omnitrophota bacterium]MDZ4241940.1 glycosyltransferase family 2 protein [Candidatus Omnitrophota bacterium]